jgi:hypothetical protein
MSYTYRIEAESTVAIWDKDQATEPPLILQPFDPLTGEAFASDADAETWAQEWISQRTAE